MIQVSNKHNVEIRLVLDLRTGTKDSRPIKIEAKSPTDNRGKIISDGLPWYDNVSPKLYKELVRMKASPLVVFDEAVEKCNAIVESMHQYDVEMLRKMMKGQVAFEGQEEISIYIDKKRRQADRDGKRSEPFQTLQNVLRARWNGMPNFKDITSDSLKAWQVDFLETPQKNGNFRTISSFNTYMRSLKTIFLMAKVDGLVTERQYPFGINKYVIKNNETRYLTVPMPVMNFIADYEYPEGRNEENFNYYKDLFMLIFYMGGINLGDLFRLKWNQYDKERSVMSWARNKTKAKSDRVRIQCPVPDLAAKIIEKYAEAGGPNDYIFSEFKPYVGERQMNVRRDEIAKRINRQAKELCKLYGFPQWNEVTCYTARHTWATYARDSGFTSDQIQKILGHESVLTTMSYLGSLDKPTIDSMRDMINKMNKLG